MTKHRTFGPDGPSPETVKPIPAAVPGMNVAVSNDDLLRFVDGALDDHGRVRVLTHLAAHPAAVGRVDAYLHQNARLRALREHLPLADTADFAAPLQAAIVERISRSRRRRSWRRLAVAAAVATLLVAGSAGLALQHRQAAVQLATDSAVAPPMQAYFLFGGPDAGSAIEPVADDGDPPAIDRTAFDWLAERSADMAFSAPDLERLDLQLIDGAVLDQQGTPAIRAVYQDTAGKPVVLFAGIGKPDVRHAFWLEREGYVSLQWRRGAMIFALVAATDNPKLSAIVELVGAAVARMPLPEAGATASSQAGGETQAAGTGAGEPAPVEAGPVQSIAVPLARPTEVPIEPPADPNPDTIHPDEHVKSADDNVPESL